MRVIGVLTFRLLLPITHKSGISTMLFTVAGTILRITQLFQGYHVIVVSTRGFLLLCVVLGDVIGLFIFTKTCEFIVIVLRFITTTIIRILCIG